MTLKFVLKLKNHTCGVKRCPSRATHDGLCLLHDEQAKELGQIPPWRAGGAPAPLALAPVASPDAELDALRQALAQEIGPVDGLARIRQAVEHAPLAAGAEWERAEGLLAKTHEKLKTVEAWQKSQTAPLMAVVKAYQGAFRPYIRALDDAKTLLKRRMADSLAAQAQRLQADLFAAAEGDTEALARAGAAVEAAPSSTRKVREWRFAEGRTYVDLPMELLQPDWDKLDALAKSAPVGAALGGVIIVSEKEVVVARARAAL